MKPREVSLPVETRAAIGLVIYEAMEDVFRHGLVDVDGCWEWHGVGVKRARIYGHISWRFGGWTWRDRAHRFAYFLWKGPIPPGLVIDHLCRNPRCCNPAHLEAVTTRENLLRGTSPAARQARQTHCIYGHPFDADNTYRWKNRRYCRACLKRRRRQTALSK